jgi:hypothetical protein
MTFLAINAHNIMLDATCHRNLETTCLKDFEEGTRNNYVAKHT